MNIVLYAVLVFLAVVVPLLLCRWLFGFDLVAWWRDTFADPILGLAIHILVASRGNAALTLGVLAVVQLVGVTLLALLWSLVNRIIFGSPFELRLLLAPGSSGQADEWEQLRSRLGDDLERLTKPQQQLAGATGRTLHRIYQRVQRAGCLIQLLTPVYYLTMLAIYLAFFNAVLQLSAANTPAQELLSAAGELAPQFVPYLPNPLIFDGINLADRSLPLTLLII